MAGFNVFAPLAAQIQAQIGNLSGIAGTITSWVVAPIVTGLTIAIMWHGFNIMRGVGGQNHLLDVFFKTLRAFLVFTVALVGSAYSDNVVGFLKDLQSSLISAFSGETNPYANLDASMDKAIAALSDTFTYAQQHISFGILGEADMSGLIALACAFFMVICLAIYALVAAVNLLLVDFSLAVIFAIGPLFVACFAFQATTRFFDSWLGAALKYIMTAVVVSAVIAIGNGIFTKFANNLNAIQGTSELDFVTAAIGALGGTGILILMAARVPALAGDIIGGIGVSILNPAVASGPLGVAAGMAASKTAGTASNGLAYAAGAASTTGPVQQAANSSLGQAAIRGWQSMETSVNAVRGRGTTPSGQTATGLGPSNAFNAGAAQFSRSSGTGIVGKG